MPRIDRLSGSQPAAGEPARSDASDPSERSWWRLLFHPPVEDEHRYVTAVMRVVLMITLAASVILLINLALAGWGRSATTLAAVAAVLLWLIRLVDRGNLSLPAHLLPLISLAATSWILYRGHGIHDVAILMLPILIFFAGLLLGKGAAMLYALLASGVVVLLVALERSGRLGTPLAAASDPFDAVSIIILLLLTASLLWVVIGHLDSSRERLQASERSLARANAELHQQTESLAASDERWRSLVDNAPDLILTVDVDGKIRFLNRGARPLREALVGRSIFDYVRRDHRVRVREALQTAARTGEPTSYEAEAIDTDGRRRWYISRVGPIWRQGAIASLTVIATDITERRRGERQRERLIRELEARNAELERFNYTVSHDLKSPLITIAGFVDLAERDAAAGELDRLHRDLETIRAAVRKLSGLLHDLLELSRTGRGPVRRHRLDFGELARDVTEMLAGPIEGAGAEVEIGADLPEIVGDRARLATLLQNLVENALKFTRPGQPPRVEIGAEASDDGWRFFVRDAGQGIEPRYQEIVFGLFNRLDPSTEGTGLGLALARRIVELHGGCLWVESDGESGSTFYFTLPGPPRSQARAVL